MSDHYLRFIPEDVDAELNMKALQKICKHKMFKGKAQIFFTDKVLQSFSLPISRSNCST